MLPTSYTDVVHGILPTVYKIIYRGYMMWIPSVYSVENNVTHIIYLCCPRYITHGIYRLFWPTLYTMSSTPYTHSICRLRHMTVIPTAYIHGICNPRYMAGMPTAYLPHYIRPHHITRRPHYMCSTRHMHMVWVTLTLFPTAYDPRHNLFSTSYTHGICTPDIPWVYAVDTTCICRGEHMPWVHMSSGDVWCI